MRTQLQGVGVVVTALQVRTSTAAASTSQTSRACGTVCRMKQWGRWPLQLADSNLLNLLNAGAAAAAWTNSCSTTLLLIILLLVPTVLVLLAIIYSQSEAIIHCQPLP